jgi:tRNA pseudouridine synthase 10
MFVADSKFSSSGREDVDVRMLGRGRPFMFELINPRKVHLSSQELSRIQDAINSTSKDIFVRDLQIVSKYILQLF